MAKKSYCHLPWSLFLRMQQRSGLKMSAFYKDVLVPKFSHFYKLPCLRTFIKYMEEEVEWQATAHLGSWQLLTVQKFESYPLSVLR